MQASLAHRLCRPGLSWIAVSLLVSACGGSGGAAINSPIPDPPGPVPTARYVSGPLLQGSGTVIVDGRELTLARGTEAGVESLRYQELVRSYLVIRPQLTGVPRPVLIILHGNGGNPQGMANVAETSDLVGTRGVIAVLPSARDQQWSENPSDPRGVDDVGFIAGVVAALKQTTQVDDQRIYLAGFSNGGAMVQRYACADPDGFAGYGVVSAVLRPAVAANCITSPARPIAYMLGTEDPIVAYGGVNGVSSAASSTAFWVSAQNCGQQQQESLPDSSNDGTATQLSRYRGCTAGSEVRLYSIQGGGHAWPGGVQQGTFSSNGRTPMDFSATEQLRQFFSAYSN